jgi:LuxR family maltose regulon positive regulatory protein
VTTRSQLAKLTRPFLGAAYARTRLFGLLDQAGGPPVLWLSGPPGSGKTTLVADYTARQQIDCLWYQIDRGDADVASFFHYLTRAAQDRTHGALPAFQPEYLGNLQAFSRNYFRDLFARLSTPFLVFDNFQDLGADSPLNGVIRDALAEVPPGCHVVVVSRNDPAAAFAGLRARGRLSVIGWSELRLTPEEVRGVAACRGIELTDADFEALYARTQGWAAGVVLLLSEGGGVRVSAGRAGEATPSVIFDYLAEEIFQNFEPPTREFLLHAGYLPQITLSMAARLGLPEDARAAIRHLGASNFLVTVRHVAPEPIYQLHPLLHEFLVARAEQTGDSAQIEGRKRLAARVLSDHEHVEAAAALLIRIADWERLRAEILRHAATLLAEGRSGILEQWIRALPESLRAADPWLTLWLANCRFPYAPREALELYTGAWRRFLAGEPASLDGLLASLNGIIESILHDSNSYAVLDPWLEAAGPLARDLTDWPSAALEARFASNMFIAVALRQPNHPDLPFWRNKTLAISQLQTDPNIRIGIDAIIAALSAWHGQFAGAQRLLDGMRELLRSHEISPVSAIKFAQAEATYYMLTGESDRCVEAANRGLGIVSDSGVRVWHETFLANGLWGALAGADLGGADAWLEQIASKPSVGRNFDSFMRAYGIAWHAMLRGDTFIAHQNLKSAAQAAANLGLPGFQGFVSVALAQVLHAGGDEPGALRELERSIALAVDGRSRLLDFMVAMCRASFADSRGARDEMLEALRSGLALGRERGFMHFLWWLPQHMARLCERALEAQIEPEYVRRLIERRRLMPTPPPYGLAAWPWRIRIRAFGAFRLEAADGEVILAGKRAGRPAELLKALVALGGRHVELDRLAATLWPRVDLDYASRSLNTTLHRLRKLLGDEPVLLVQAGELHLNPALCWVDTWAFERRCDELLALLRRPETRAEELLEAAEATLALYGGALLAGDGGARWLVAPREQWRALLLRTLATSAEWLERSGAGDAVIRLYRLALEREPLQEPLYRALMQTLAASGRAIEAVEVYERCRTTLDAELKSPPSAATTDLYRSLKGA